MEGGSIDVGQTFTTHAANARVAGAEHNETIWRDTDATRRTLTLTHKHTATGQPLTYTLVRTLFSRIVDHSVLKYEKMINSTVTFRSTIGMGRDI